MEQIKKERFPSKDDFVKFVAGVDKVLAVSDWKNVTSEIIDKKTDTPKTIHAVECKITEEDGQAVEKTLTITSKRLVNALMLLFDEQKPFKVKIKEIGSGFEKQFKVEKV